MTTLILMATLGFQAPAAPPSNDPSSAGRRVPPPVPHPPGEQPPTQAPVITPRPTPQAPQQAPQATQQVLPRHLFLRQHDVNLDGRLEPAELERRFARHFALADANGDGFLDANEILLDRHNIGKAARRMEGLDLDRDGHLISRADRAPVPITDIARGVLDAIDAARSGGTIEAPGVSITFSRSGPGAAPPVHDATAPNALPMRPATPTIPPPPVIPTPPTVPSPKAQTGQGALAQPPAKKLDDLPNAEQIIANLDKDGDGMISESEAVDQLAKNFKALDKNHDGKLSKEEIDRGLRLARLFGIKPMQPPQTYKNDKASGAPKAQK